MDNEHTNTIKVCICNVYIAFIMPLDYFTMMIFKVFCLRSHNAESLKKHKKMNYVSSWYSGIGLIRN